MTTPVLPGGLWPAMLTPFSDDGRVNPAMVERMVELYLGQGLDGIYLLGATGQGLALSVAERQQTAELTLRAVRGRLPVVVHVGCVATGDAVTLARHAAEHGATGLSAIPPVYFGTPIDAEFAHYTQISQAGGLPFLPYINTVLSGAFSMPPARYVERLLELPNIAGAKVTTFDLNAFGLLSHHARGRLLLYSGADELLCQAAISGATGAIGSSYNLFGPECRRALHACAAGQFDAARRFMQIYQSVMEPATSAGGYYHFLRAGMRLRHGIEIGPGRTPACLAGRSWADADVLALIATLEKATPA